MLNQTGTYEMKESLCNFNNPKLQKVKKKLERAKGCIPEIAIFLTVSLFTTCY